MALTYLFHYEVEGTQLGSLTTSTAWKSNDTYRFSGGKIVRAP